VANLILMKISIAIPVYNSELTIGILVEQLIEELRPEYDIEIVLVNDHSTDNTEQVCVSLFEKYPNIIKFYSLAKNVGEHNAIIAALNFVSGDWVIVMDDDLQNPVSEVKKLIEFALSHSYDVVYTYYTKKYHSLWRNLGSKFNDKMANLILNKPKDLYLSSFRAINKKIVREIIKYRYPFTFIDGLILRTTSNIGKIQVQHSPRKFGKSHYTFSKLISLWSNMFFNFSLLPIRWTLFCGIFLMFVSFAFIIIGLWKLTFLLTDIRWLTLIIVMFFAGLFLFFLGIIGEYIGRLFLSLNGHPQFIISKKFELNNSSFKSQFDDA